MIVYVEPDPDRAGAARTVRITEEEAIQRQLGSAMTSGYRYTGDLEALEDFIAIHHAWTEDDPL